MIDLDATDVAILKVLQGEGRITNAELAERVNLSASAALRRTRALEEAGVIDGFWWMTLVGLGSYLAYVPYGSVLFDRLMASTGAIGTAVFAPCPPLK